VNPGAISDFACPTCKGGLQLTVFREEPRSVGSEERARAALLGVDPGSLARVIEEGLLTCSACATWYPVLNFVPVLLDYRTELHREFRERHEARSGAFRGFDGPKGTPRPGEEAVQRSFTREWRTLPLDQVSFMYTPEQRDRFIRLELDWPPGLDRPDLRVLEVGCGSGFESQSLDRVTRGRILGIDLNLSLLRNGPALAAHPFIDVAVASLFALPARPGSFDLVYSSGVLHHSWSTKAAFDEIARYRKPEGAIYVWVYARDDIALTLRTCLNWIFEELFRPRIARLPEFLQDAIVRLLSWRHYRRYRQLGTYNREAWTFANSEHTMRDQWTPLFAHRHGFGEVIGWFLEKGLDYRLIDPRQYRELFGNELRGIGIRGTGRGTKGVRADSAN
jgi:SAM-dependent methyltransferase